MIDRMLAALERRLEKFALPGLVRALVFFNALVFVLLLYNPRFLDALAFHPDAIRAGEFWRVITFLFIPPTTSPLFLLIALYFLWIIGDGLEEAWGAFRLNLFFLITAAASVAAGFIFGAGATGFYINTFLFLSFATLYPNFTVLLFFILPVAVKWLGLVTFWFTMAEFTAGTTGVKAAIAAAALGYVLYFGPFFFKRWREQAQVAIRRGRFDKDNGAEDSALHRCAACGVTEISHPDREFRVTAEGKELCNVCLAKRRAKAANAKKGG